MTRSYDVVLATQLENLNPKVLDEYHQNILEEERLLLDALQQVGLSAKCVGWDDADFDWNSTRAVVIRETWDYFHKIDEYRSWLELVNDASRLVNPYDTLVWNLDKFYLRDLNEEGVNIPETIFLEKGDQRFLADLQTETGWAELIIKPAVAGAARDTYRINVDDISAHESIFRKLVDEERMLFQQFQPDVVKNGEKTLVLMDGEYTHGILKMAKKGDFRVQDDHGGTVHSYEASEKEIAFAKQTLAKVRPLPLYARVDIITDVNGNLALQELELIEPELWFRFNPESARKMARAIKKSLEHG